MPRTSSKEFAGGLQNSRACQDRVTGEDGQAKKTIVESGLLEDHAGAHAAASVCSGLVSSLLSTPADVIKTRLMNQVRPLTEPLCLVPGPRTTCGPLSHTTE